MHERHLKRAGLDYWRHVEPRIWPTWAAFEAALPELGEPFFFSAESERGLWSVSFPERSVLIFGSETSGLAAEIRRRYAERLVAIPMRPGRAPRPRAAPRPSRGTSRPTSCWRRPGWSRRASS